MLTVYPERFIFTGILTDANATTATGKSEQATRSSFCQRLRSGLRAVKNTSLKLMPCLLSKERKAERSRISEEKAWACIKETLLNRVAENKVQGIFRISVENKSLQKIRQNKVKYSFVKKLAADKKQDVVDLYANVLKENLKGATKQLNYLDILRIQKFAQQDKGNCIRDYVESKMDFATEDHRRNFFSSMDVVAEIYHALKNKPCEEAPLDGIARIISPSICNPAQFDQHTQLTDIHEIAKRSNEAAELTLAVLENWRPQQAS